MSFAGFKGAEGPAGPLVNENYVTLLKDDFDDYLDEIERLRQQNAELVEALKYCRQKIAYMRNNGEWYESGRALDIADAAIAKATGD